MCFVLICFSSESKGFSYIEQFGLCNRERRADSVGHLPNHQAVHHHDIQYTPNQNQEIFFLHSKSIFKTKIQTKLTKSYCCTDMAQALLHAYSPCLCSAKLTASSLKSSCKWNALLSLRVCTHPSLSRQNQLWNLFIEPQRLRRGSVGLL